MTSMFLNVYTINSACEHGESFVYLLGILLWVTAISVKLFDTHSNIVMYICLCGKKKLVYCLYMKIAKIQERSVVIKEKE